VEAEVPPFETVPSTLPRVSSAMTGRERELQRLELAHRTVRLQYGELTRALGDGEPRGSSGWGLANIIIIRTDHSKALIVSGAGYNDNALDSQWADESRRASPYAPPCRP
jgi:hypothetical protein